MQAIGHCAPERIEKQVHPRSIARAALCFSEQALHAQPLLRPEAASVLPPPLHLVAHAGGIVALLEVRGAEQHVPPGQEHAEVMAAQRRAAPLHHHRAGLAAFVAQADAVVQAMEARADPQALAQATEPQPEVGMLKAFAQLRSEEHTSELQSLAY